MILKAVHTYCFDIRLPKFGSGRVAVHLCFNRLRGGILVVSRSAKAYTSVSEIAACIKMSTLPTGRRASEDFLGRGGLPANSQTLSQLHRTQTTKPTTNVYGKNMWDDDEYVDTGGNSVQRTPTGGPAARRINQQRKVQAQTVKLPDNPFMDSDYADMTGHQRNEHGMEKLRSTHQYKSMKARSQSTSRVTLESETDGISRQASDVDLVSSDRNLSFSSSRSGSGTSQFTRSDTSPAFRFQGSIKENSSDVQRNDSVSGVRPVSIEDIASAKESSNTITPPLINGDISGHTMLPERQSSFAKSTLGGRIHNSSQHAPSPDHSVISTETTLSFLKPPAPGSPAVVYKNSGFDSNPDNSQVAIVVDITKPTSPMYGSFANNGQKSDDKSTLKFDASPPMHRAKHVALISLAIILIVALAATVVTLVITIVQQNDKISQLEVEIASLQSIAAPASTANSDRMTTKHVTDSLTTHSVQTTSAQPAVVTTVTESTASTAVATAIPSDKPSTTSDELSTTSDELSTTSSINATTASPDTTSVVSMTTLQKTNYTVEIGTTGSGNDTTTTTT